MNFNRRQLIQTIALAGTALVIQACSKKSTPEANVSGELGADANNAANTAAPTLVSETDATATALGYKHDGSTIPAAEKPEKNGIAGGNQNCTNCAFYAPIEGVVDGGKCSLIMAGYVKSTGWCKSWSVKQG